MEKQTSSKTKADFDKHASRALDSSLNSFNLNYWLPPLYKKGVIFSSNENDHHQEREI